MKKSKDFEFELFGTTWKVVFVDAIESEEENVFKFGNTNSVTSTILIATKDMEGKPLAKDIIDITLLHELVHCIFGTGCYLGSNSDEPLTEWVARCLKSLMKQGVLEYAK